MLFRVVAFCLLSFLAASTGPAAPAGGAFPPTDMDRSLALTIYDDFALVRDRRTFRLSAGEQTLLFADISPRIQPESAFLAGSGLRVLEQTFAYTPLTLQTLLERNLGQEVLLASRNPETGEQYFEKAQLLSVTDGVLLRIGDRIRSADPKHLVFSNRPDTLRDRPALRMRVVSDRAGERPLQLSYLTGGLSWQADYVAELSPDGTGLDLAAWVTLKNESGTAYREARVQLMAGTVHRMVAEAMEQPMMQRRFKAAVTPARPVVREKIFGYHLYSLARPVTLRRRERRQVALVQAAGVSCRRELVLHGRGGYYRARMGEIGARPRVEEILLVRNSDASGLGMPLPAGVVRVYSRDGSGLLQFVGEDRIDHTPKGGQVRLRLGASFDLTADRKQVEFKKLPGSSPHRTIFESGYRITLHNGGSREATVKVMEEIPGDWTMLAESLPHTREDARTAAWSVQVPAGGSTVLTYRVRVR